MKSPDQLRLVGVKYDQIGDVWADIYPMIADFVTRSKGEWSFASLLNDLKERHKQLWVGVDADGRACVAALTEVYTGADGEPRAAILAAGDGGLKRAPRQAWQHLAQEWAELSNQQGFKGVSIISRPAWARIIGKTFKVTHVILEQDFG